jgi:hypothetical protein
MVHIQFDTFVVPWTESQRFDAINENFKVQLIFCSCL